MEQLKVFLEGYSSWLYIPEMKFIDFIEILIIAFLVYQVIVWIKNTKAWMLLKGMVVITCFVLVAAIFNMQTILYLTKASINVLAIVAVVVFQPELRRALEKIGEKNILSTIVPFDKKENVRFSDETVEAIVEATFAMSEVKTGALIVVEQAIQLQEYETTGIQMDCLVSTQILMNIFEHNTPLHDGAVILRGDRIVSATCYLPLSDNSDLSKDLGTRHRAAIGMTEVCDALVIAVSEETGAVSVALGGRLERNVSADELRKKLHRINKKSMENNKTSKRLFRWKGGAIDEKNLNQ